MSAADEPLVSVVIPSWNTRELLRVCLRHLEASELGAEQWIVIDNASGDGSADMVAEEFPRAHLVRNQVNEGFARGCNQGIALARGRYVLLLNADTEMAPDALRRMVDFLERHGDYAAAAPRLVHPDGRTQAACQAFPTWRTALFFATPLERWFPENRELRRYFRRDFDHEHDADVEQPPAACLLVRRSVLDELGPFDENLWLFYNDVDLSKRWAKAGWRTRFLAGARVVHHVGASTRQFGGFLAEWHRNRLVYYRKHHGRVAGWWLKACVALSLVDYTATQIGRRLRGREAEPLGPMWRLYGDYLGR